MAFKYRFAPSPERSIAPFRGDSWRDFSSWIGDPNTLYAILIACLTLSIVGCGAGTGSVSEYLQLSPRSVDFGDVSVGQTVQNNVSIVNVGPTSVAISQLSLSDQSFSIANSEKFPINIPAGGSHTLSIGFAPVSTVDYSGQLSMMDANSKPLGQLKMQGHGANGKLLSLSSSSLSFGSIAVNSMQMQTLTLTSTGVSPVTITSATISGTGFTLVGGSFPMTLNPSQTTTLQIQFNPTASGVSSGQLTINSNSSSSTNAVVALAGTGMAATPLANPSMAASTSSLVFGNVTLNSPTTLPITLTSTGTTPVTVSSAAITGSGFTLVGGTFPVTLNPSQTLTLRVQFDPTTSGTAGGQLTVASDSTNGNTVVSLSGIGAAIPIPTLSVSTTSLSFGSVTVNSPTGLPITLSSTGTSPVTLNSVGVTGTGFTIAGGNFPTTLNPGQTLTLQVQFDPTVTGIASGQFTVNSNSTNGGTTNVSLSGNGTAAPTLTLSASTANLSFGSVTVNSPVTLPVTLTSTGTSPVTVSSVTISGAGFTLVGGTVPATLNPSQTLTVQVQFNPTATGATTGQLTIISNSTNGSTATVSLSGTGTAAPNPILSLSTASLGFGSVTVNSPTTLPVTLTSTGTSPVTVNSATIGGAGFTLVSGTLPVTLNPTQTITLQVQFDPTATGAASGQLTISSNSTNASTAIVSFSGTGTSAPNPILSLSTASLSFGNVTVNAPATLSVTLTSTGTSPVTVNSAAITGAAFTVVGGTLPVTLNPTQTMTVQVQFDPTVTGATNGQLTISSNSTNGSTATVTLSGTGTAALAPILSASTANLSFGNVTVNSPTTLPVTLTSTGTSPVTVNSATIGGVGFMLVGGNLPVTLNPSQTVTLQVQFDPTATGAVSGQLTISSNSTNGNTATVTLSGTGTAALAPILSVSTANLSFGGVTVNSPATLPVTLTSTGTSPVTVNSAAITGAGFTVVGATLPITLNPTQTMTLQVQFDPTATGTASGQLMISSNSTNGSTTIVSLSGTGTPAPNPVLSLSTANLSFGSVTVNSQTTLPVTLTSTGSSPVTVNSAILTGSGFTLVSGTFPQTLNPTQSLTLQVQFDPKSTGTASGQVTITSNSTSGATAVISLGGTGTPSNPILSISTTTLSFGNVNVNSPTTLSVTLTSTGTSSVTVNAASVTGAGFTLIGGAFPITLNPAQTAMLQVQFDPTTGVAASGQLSISSNSINGSPTVVSLNGTGVVVPHEVDLTWNAPSSSPDPVAGYNIYRATGTGSLQLVNSSMNLQTAYVDSTVISGTTYSYVVKSVDSSGTESIPSNEITVTIP